MNEQSSDLGTKGYNRGVKKLCSDGVKNRGENVAKKTMQRRTDAFKERRIDAVFLRISFGKLNLCRTELMFHSLGVY